jgi:hypothetical protein
VNGKHKRCAESTGFTPRYNVGLIGGEREKPGSKMTLAIDVTKIIGSYVIEVDIVKKGFTLRDWFTVLENSFMQSNFSRIS